MSRTACLEEAFVGGIRVISFQVALPLVTRVIRHVTTEAFWYASPVIFRFDVSFRLYPENVIVDMVREPPGHNPVGDAYMRSALAGHEELYLSGVPP